MHNIPFATNITYGRGRRADPWVESGEASLNGERSTPNKQSLLNASMELASNSILLVLQYRMEKELSGTDYQSVDCGTKDALP